MPEQKDIKSLLELDTQNMFDVLKNFPRQVSEACEIGRKAPLFKEKPVSREFLVLGMGGSAIGGDLLASYLGSAKGAEKLTIRVNRGYNIPQDINSHTNVIASSYSGNTEETIAGLEEALKFTKRIICITTGGKLAEAAIKYELPIIRIPAGLQPRCALGYSFFPMLYTVMRNGLLEQTAVDNIEKAIKSLIIHLDNLSAIYSNINSDKNKALDLAARLQGTVPVIYSAYQRLDSVNVRWRCQINENAKNLAFGNFLPEMNHNEINAWSYPNDIMTRFSIILMRDIEDNERVKLRFNALKQLIGENVYNTSELYGEGSNLLVRMFDLVYLGDWFSYYLALLNNTDPTPIPQISRLKDILSSH